VSERVCSDFGFDFWGRTHTHLYETYNHSADQVCLCNTVYFFILTYIHIYHYRRVSNKCIPAGLLDAWRLCKRDWWLSGICTYWLYWLINFSRQNLPLWSRNFGGTFRVLHSNSKNKTSISSGNMRISENT
jgi:hypothetical protein